jgi:hypothetical protein
MIKLREIEDKDLNSLADLLADGFPFAVEKGFPYTTREFWLSLFGLWWKDNPAYSDLIPRGWILESGEKIVGFIGNIPVKFVISGEIKIAVSANGWYVDPSFRGGSSLNLFNQFVKQSNVPLFLFKIEDESFEKILSKYKFERFILPRSQKEYAYIIDRTKFRYILSKFLSMQKMPGSDWVIESLKRSGIFFYAWLFQRRLKNTEDTGYISTESSACDESFSRIWDSNTRECDVTISRDVATLNWLYFSSARFRKRVVIQCNRTSDKRLAGYMVFDVQRIKTTDEATLQLMDLCIEDHDPRVLTSLILSAIQIGKQNGASLLVLWGNSPELETFLNKFIMKRSIQYHRYIKFSDDKINLDRKKIDKVCLPVIFPPQ